MIRADGGHVLLTAQAAGQLLHTVVNNTGIIEARTIANHRARSCCSATWTAAP